MTRAWFPTLIYSEPLARSGLEKFNAGLAQECRALRSFDKAGRAWSVWCAELHAPFCAIVVS